MTESDRPKKLKMPKFNLLPAMNLKMKILAGFSATIAILMIVVGFGFKSFVTVGHEVEHYSEYVEEAALVAEIESDFLNLEVYAVEFALTGEPKMAEKAKKAMVVLNDVLASSEKHVKDPEDIELIKEISHLAHVYEKDFEKISHLIAEANSLIYDKLQPTGDKLVLDLDKIMKLAVAEKNAPAIKIVNEMTRHAIEARRFSSLALAGQDKNAFDKAEHEFDYLQKSLKKLEHVAHTPEEIKLEKEMIELLAIYKAAFEKSVEDKHQIDELLHGEMTHMAEKLLADTKLLKDKLVTAENEIRAQTLADIEQAELMMAVVGLIGIIVGVGTALLLGSQISKPVIGMTKAMRELADGNLDTVVPAEGRKDEIGEMSKAVKVFKDNAIRARELEAKAEEQKLAEVEQKHRLMNELADDFDSRIGGIVETVSAASAELNSTAQSMASIAEETSIQANSVSDASQRASGNVQTVASATEEMANSISEINQQIVQASEVSKKAVNDVSSTATQMGLLAETADKIGNVISMISDIAEQTNLLALNATIESARAGEAGKGFAVVATEVKALANETAKATENISGLISEIQGQTKGAVDAISGIGTVISKLDETSSAIAAAMTEQGATTQEVARNVEEASVGTQEVSANISGVTQASQESGAAAGEVTSAAAELSRQAEIMKTEVTKFLGEIRAA